MRQLGEAQARGLGQAVAARQQGVRRELGDRLKRHARARQAQVVQQGDVERAALELADQRLGVALVQLHLDGRMRLAKARQHAGQPARRQRAEAADAQQAFERGGARAFQRAGARQQSVRLAVARRAGGRQRQPARMQAHEQRLAPQRL